jgi:hypothetical protein
VDDNLAFVRKPFNLSLNILQWLVAAIDDLGIAAKGDICELKFGMGKD